VRTRFTVTGCSSPPYDTDRTTSGVSDVGGTNGFRKAAPLVSDNLENAPIFSEVLSLTNKFRHFVFY
jgi:hypothetical protein